jgi:4-hydroxy-3-polyprenylbenzoate decarboxylase
MGKYFKNLREYLEVLENRNKLIRIKSPINKDSELHPLIRLQFRGLREKERKAFLFENVVDSRGKQYDIPVAVGALAGSSDICAIGMMCQPEEIGEKLAEAQRNPIPPRIVSNAPVHDEVFMGNSLLKKGGLDEFPIPISTPGYDVAPYITAPFCVTKDPETGIRNVGAYRAQLKAPTRVGMWFAEPMRGGMIHWNKAKKAGMPLEVAIVIGGPPSIGYVSVAKIPLDMDELAVAGSIAGEPLDVVKCKTVDLEVPAEAEIVIEGKLSTEELEPEGPFGEAAGFVGMTEMNPYLTVTAITHRKKPIWLAIISQYPPSESSKIRQHANQADIFKYLKHELGMDHVLAVASHEAGGSGRYWVVKVARTDSELVWQTLEAVAKRHPNIPEKVIVAVDEDVDPWDPDSVNMAICQRVQPHRDCRIVSRLSHFLMDCSLLPSEELSALRKSNEPTESSLLLINAAMKWPYPPLSLPKKEFMEKAIVIWEREGLPRLELREPWWGYNLGYWSEEDEENALRATRGEYYSSAEIQAEKRKPV